MNLAKLNELVAQQTAARESESVADADDALAAPATVQVKLAGEGQDVLRRNGRLVSATEAWTFAVRRR